MSESILNWLQHNEERDLGAALVRLARLAEAAHRYETATATDLGDADEAAARADSRSAPPHLCTSNDTPCVDP